MKECIVSFSGRSGGNCSRIAEIIQQKKVDAAVYDFSVLSITPCSHCRYECFEQREKCPHFSDPEFAICEEIAKSDIAYFIVPNYCGYPCANFFIFNERSLCYFQHHNDLLNQYLAVRKKFIVISNTEQDNFTTAFCQHIPETSDPDILFLSSKQFGKTSIDGNLMESENAKELLFRFIDKL